MAAKCSFYNDKMSRWLKIHASRPCLRNSSLTLCILNANDLSFVTTTLKNACFFAVTDIYPRTLITTMLSIKKSSSSPPPTPLSTSSSTTTTTATQQQQHNNNNNNNNISNSDLYLSYNKWCSNMIKEGETWE